MIRISQIKLRPDHTPEDLTAAVIRRLRTGADSKFRYQIMRQSIDARKKPDIFYIYTVDVDGFSSAEEKRILRRTSRDRDIAAIAEKAYHVPEHGAEKMHGRPVIVGSGPAGLFCALLLAREGYRPLVIERGEPVGQRTKTVRSFWETNELDPDSNVQFGEGGAGTFSDGKLNTSIKDPSGRIRFVLQTFVSSGADEDILYSYKPHIGTDRLREVIVNIREEIISLGGEFLFSHRLEEIEDTFAAKSGKLRNPSTEPKPEEPRYILHVRKLKEDQEEIHKPAADKSHQTDKEECREASQTKGKTEHEKSAQKEVNKDFQDVTQKTIYKSNDRHISIRTDILILALGHSARDTFEMLLDQGMKMQPKAFAVGVRIQHPQQVIDEAMYGKDCRYPMPPSPYKLTCQLEQGGVYSFCMCPGGYVVNASSEPGMIAVNGMSLRARDSGSANSAIVMTVSPEQYAAYLRQWGLEAGVFEENDISSPGIHGTPEEMEDDHQTEKGKPDDAQYGSMSPLIGLSFVRMLERRAWEAGRGSIPAQTFAGFCRCVDERSEVDGDIKDWGKRKDDGNIEACKDSKVNGDSKACGESGDRDRQCKLIPRIEGRYIYSDVRGIFPEVISDGLEEAIKRFDRVIPGFASPDALLCAPESRTSSPVRIVRDPESLEALSHPGIYPCGEGAGYAGGITSAAVDGLRVAEAVIRRYAVRK